jgi:hypothetical protein
VHHLDHHRAVERDVQRVVDVGHPAFTDAMHYAVPAAGHMSQRGNRRIWRLRIAIDRDGKQLATAETSGG